MRIACESLGLKSDCVRPSAAVPPWLCLDGEGTTTDLSSSGQHPLRQERQHNDSPQPPVVCEPSLVACDSRFQDFDVAYDARPHILQVDLDELVVQRGGCGPMEMDPSSLALLFESSVSYFVSLHPTSSTSASVELPAEVPQFTVDKHHMVSGARSVGPSLAFDGSSGEDILFFDESLSMRVDHLDTHFLLYLWGRRSSAFGGHEDSLFGCRAIPLRDVSLHGRLAVWDICDLETGVEVAELRMRCSIATTPGAIQLPHLSDVAPTSLRLNWSAPLVDNGRPVIGYSITILEPCAEEWTDVCECTVRTFFELMNLIPSSVYMVNIRALNEVGLGESSEFEIATPEGISDSDAFIGCSDEPGHAQSLGSDVLHKSECLTSGTACKLYL